jgi:tRNA(adenine34) deaminase
MPDNFEYMDAAMAEARAAEAAGEVPVGAVVVCAGEIVGWGQNRVLRDNDPTAHAEMVAMRAAGVALENYRLEGAELYVTLEPCSMCAGAITHARVARLIYGAADPKAGACRGELSPLHVLNHSALNHRVEVVEGVMADECGTMLREFFKQRR